MKIREVTISKYMKAINDSFSKGYEYETKQSFGLIWKISHGLSPVLIELGIMKKNEKGLYYIARKTSRQEVNKISIQINNNIFKNKKQPLKNKNNPNVLRLMDKPKIQTQIDCKKEKSITQITVPYQQKQAKKFRLFWGLLEFEY
jgi:hypothetical protein